MGRIAFYGLGEHFEKHILQSRFICEKLKTWELLAVIDRNKCGSVIRINNTDYPVVSLDEWTDFGIDKVIITTAKYQNGIRNDLRKHGFQDGQIEILDEAYPLFMDNLNLIEPCTHGTGLEVGGPSRIFSRIYDMCRSCDGVNFSADTVWWKQGGADSYLWNGHDIGKMYIVDATDLKGIRDESYDFVMSSNNLEHIANPLKALDEFYRVVRKDGVIIIVVPRKYANFDHNRSFTPFEHILEDYQNGITEDDLSHLPEIIENHDYDMNSSCGGKEKFIQRAEKNFENRCLHHHVFNQKCLKAMFDYFNIQLLELAEGYTNYWIIGKK